MTEDYLDFMNSMASHASVQMSHAETLVFWSVRALTDWILHSGEFSHQKLQNADVHAM